MKKTDAYASLGADRKRFMSWQIRTILITMAGYALFYFVRKNFSLAMPGLTAEYGISNTNFGWIIFAGSLVYGFSRFINGYVVDRIRGRIVMALGLLAGEAAMFHLFTHAWFKALLFLGAGAIIFACHHEQDIWKMGGIMKRMKLTSLTFIIGTMALIAIPFTSGFFSKEAILEAALHKNPVFFWIGGGVALLTTFYMMRVIFVVFFGRERSHSAEYAREVGGVMLIPLLILAVLAVISGYGFIADRLVPFNGFAVADFHMGMPFYVSMGALVLGILLAAVLYAGSPASDKLSGNAVSRALANRLSRIEGQVRGIRAMLDKDVYCADILVQVGAVNAALNGFSKELLAQHISTCVADDLRAGSEAKLDELVNLLPKLMK